MWLVDSLWYAVKVLLPKLSWFFVFLVSDDEPCAPPPVLDILGCGGLGFHSPMAYLDFTLQHCTRLGAWYDSRFAALNMSDAATYCRHHSCNFNHFLFPSLLVAGMLTFWWCCLVFQHRVIGAGVALPPRVTAAAAA